MKIIYSHLFVQTFTKKFVPCRNRILIFAQATFFSFQHIMKIDLIYIPCYRRDYRLTRICVASIRHWYPDIPIVLVKDLMMRNFDTSELEKTFNVSVFPQKAKLYGWGFSKFEVFFEKERKRFLMLDSDIVLAGPVLDLLEQYNEDWIVHHEPFTQQDLLRYYFDPEKIKTLDADFNFPGYTFNTGQLVGITGQLKREEFNPFIDWTEPRNQKYRHAFTFGGEQPLLNYMIMKKQAKGELTVRRLDFMHSGLEEETQHVLLERIKQKEGYPFIIHWHDKKPKVFLPSMKLIPRNDILLFFENEYYRKAGVNSFTQYMRTWYEYIEDRLFMNAARVVKRVKG